METLLWKHVWLEQMLTLTKVSREGIFLWQNYSSEAVCTLRVTIIYKLILRRYLHLLFTFSYVIYNIITLTYIIYIYSKHIIYNIEKKYLQEFWVLTYSNCSLKIDSIHEIGSIQFSMASS